MYIYSPLLRISDEHKRRYYEKDFNTDRNGSAFAAICKNTGYGGNKLPYANDSEKPLGNADESRYENDDPRKKS